MQSIMSVLNTSENWTQLTELPDVHHVILVLEYGRFVVIYIEVVWRAENCHDAGEPSRPGFSVHSVARILRFVRSNDGQQVILLEEGTRGGIREEIRASADVVVDEEIVRFLLAELFERVSPKNVAHQAVGGRLPEAINLRMVSDDYATLAVLTHALQIIQGVKLRAQAAVYAEKLLVHDCSQRQCAE